MKRIKGLTHIYNNFSAPPHFSIPTKGLPADLSPPPWSANPAVVGYVPISDHLPVVLPFKMEEPVDIAKEYTCPLVATLHPGLHELSPYVCQTDLMVRILIPIRFQLITDEDIGVNTPNAACYPSPHTEPARTVPPQGRCPDGSSSPPCGQE